MVLQNVNADKSVSSTSILELFANIGVGKDQYKF